MLIRIALILELLSVVICVYRINERKVKFDVGTMALFMGLLVVLDYLNSRQMSGMYNLIIYVIIYFFIKSKLRISYIDAGISMLLLMIILPAIQFVCLLIAAILVPKYEMVRTIVGNVLVLSVCIFILPKCKINRVQKGIKIEGKFVKIVFIFIVVVVFALLFQNMVLRGVYVEIFIFVIPAILFLLAMLAKWSHAQIKIEDMQSELQFKKGMQKRYEELLIKVRMRQHEFKNHMAAIFSTHYTYDTYEKLVKAQAEYCKKLQQENKYNNLLLIGNNVLAGFLYGKFQDAEEDGVSIEYSIKSSIEMLQMPEYYLIEVLGILLDNAVEAVSGCDGEREIIFSVIEDNYKYLFSIKNRNRYVTYSEIEKWFLAGYSEKGSERGIGLFHAKEICRECNCSIGCKNLLVNEENWIEFTLEVDKAGS